MIVKGACSTSSRINLHCSLIYCSMVKYFRIIQPCNSHLVCENLYTLQTEHQFCYLYGNIAVGESFDLISEF